MKNLFVKTLIIAFICSLFTFSLDGQDLDSDNMVLFMKANILYETGRYDEAVRMYNRILSADEDYVNAYIMRGKTKYALAAYKGTKMDLMQYMERAGVNKEWLKVMADTEYKLNNLKAANNYIKTVIEMDPFDGELYYLAGMIALDDGRKNEACENFAIGSSLEHHKSTQMFNTTCYGYVVREKREVEPAGEVASSVDSLIFGGSSSIPPLERDRPDIEVINETPEDLTKAQEIKIDDKLNLVITNGLGVRLVESRPNIFLISSENGHVAIDICVDGEGKVVEAEFNRDRSTIYTSSMTSLAMRKAREFVFIASLKTSQCGTMIFNVKA